MWGTRRNASNHIREAASRVFERAEMITLVAPGIRECISRPRAILVRRGMVNCDEAPSNVEQPSKRAAERRGFECAGTSGRRQRTDAEKRACVASSSACDKNKIETMYTRACSEIPARYDKSDRRVKTDGVYLRGAQ